MKLLLFGANGQVGTELRRFLRPLGEVVACGQEEIDLADLQNLASEIHNISPSVIVNAAAYTAVDRAESEPEIAEIINVDAVGVMANEASRLNIPLIHYSTDYVFDGTNSGLYLENDKTNPLSVYGKTKLQGENEIRSSGCKHLIFRTSWVYAKNGSNFPKTMLRLSQEQEELRVVNDQHGVPTSASLIASVTANCIGKLSEEYFNFEQTSGTYHLTPSGKTNWYEIAKFVLEESQLLGTKLRVSPDMVQPVPSTAFPTPAIRPANSLLDSQKIKTTFGVNLPPWQEDVRKFVKEMSKKVVL